MDLSASILWSILSQLSCPTFHWRLVLAGPIDFLPQKETPGVLILLHINNNFLLSAPSSRLCQHKEMLCIEKMSHSCLKICFTLAVIGTGRERIKKRLFMEFTKDSLAAERPYICGSLRALERLLFCTGNCLLRLFGTSNIRNSWPTSMNHVHEQAWMLARW